MAFVLPPTPIVVTLEVLQGGFHGTVVATAVPLAAVDHYEWFEDGVSVGRSADPAHTRAVELNDAVEVECIATRYDDFDAHRNAPQSYPAWRRIEWQPSVTGDVDHYRIDHATGESTPASWTEVGRLRHDAREIYSFRSAALADLTFHWFRVTPVGTDGNDGTAKVFTPESQHVRRPDAPDFDTSFDDGTQRITISEAA